jgi:hypothetical protein
MTAETKRMALRTPGTGAAPVAELGGNRMALRTPGTGAAPVARLGVTG